MAYEMKPGKGSLFKNDKKTADSHPNAKGKIMLPNGEVRWISAWTNETSAGEKWQALVIGELVAGQPVSQHSQAKGNGFQQQNDSDIPF